jgi:hypothetical protein
LLSIPHKLHIQRSSALTTDNAISIPLIGLFVKQNVVLLVLLCHIVFADVVLCDRPVAQDSMLSPHRRANIESWATVNVTKSSYVDSQISC